MKKRYIYLIIIIVSIVSIFPLLVKSNVWGHDTNFHLANIEDITNSISFTNPLPKISTNIGNNLGYGVHLFYPPLPHYISGYINLFFKIINLGTDNCLVFIYLIASILSGISMYHLSLELTKNKYIALTSSVIYLLFPYRMGDIIVRSSLNEVFIFIFIPMILLSLNRLINNKSYLWLFVVGYTGLILSHLVMTLYTTLFLIIWAIICLKKENIIKLIKGVILVTILVLPFLSLLISQKLNGNYLVFLDGYMSNINYMNAFSLSIKDFLIPLNNYSWDIPHFINILVLISFIFSIYFFIKEKKKDKNIIYLLILYFICFIMCLNIFPWKIMPKTLYMIQFPWRLQTYIAISISIIAPLCLKLLDKKYIKYVTTLFIVVLLIMQIPFLKSMMTYEFLLEKEINYDYGTGHSKEYLPVSTYKNIEYFNNRDNKINCNDCNSKIIKNNSKELIFEINTTNEQKIELPKLYYFGYQLKNNNNEDIKLYENENGFIEFIGNTGTFTLTYKTPLLYRISIFLSINTILIIIVYQLHSKTNKKDIKKY